jgi:hypothetical protein
MASASTSGRDQTTHTGAARDSRPKLSVFFSHLVAKPLSAVVDRFLIKSGHRFS